MYYFYGRAIRGMEFVCRIEVVHLLESPLLEVSLYCTNEGVLVARNTRILSYTYKPLKFASYIYRTVLERYMYIPF